MTAGIDASRKKQRFVVVNPGVMVVCAPRAHAAHIKTGDTMTTTTTTKERMTVSISPTTANLIRSAQSQNASAEVERLVAMSCDVKMHAIQACASAGIRAAHVSAVCELDPPMLHLPIAPGQSFAVAIIEAIKSHGSQRTSIMSWDDGSKSISAKREAHSDALRTLLTILHGTPDVAFPFWLLVRERMSGGTVLGVQQKN